MTIMTTTPKTIQQEATNGLQLQLLQKPASLTQEERQHRLALIRRQIANGGAYSSRHGYEGPPLG